MEHILATKQPTHRNQPQRRVERCPVRHTSGVGEVDPVREHSYRPARHTSLHFPLQPRTDRQHHVPESGRPLRRFIDMLAVTQDDRHERRRIWQQPVGRLQHGDWQTGQNHQRVELLLDKHSAQPPVKRGIALPPLLSDANKGPSPTGVLGSSRPRDRREQRHFVAGIQQRFSQHNGRAAVAVCLYGADTHSDLHSLTFPSSRFLNRRRGWRAA